MTETGEGEETERRVLTDDWRGGRVSGSQVKWFNLILLVWRLCLTFGVLLIWNFVSQPVYKRDSPALTPSLQRQSSGHSVSSTSAAAVCFNNLVHLKNPIVPLLCSQANSNSYRQVLKMNAAVWRHVVSDVICTRVRPFNTEADSPPACTLGAFPQTQMGTAGGAFPAAREFAPQTRCDSNTTTSLPLSCGSDWNTLLLWECREAVSRRHLLVWKISAISVSAAGLMRTRSAEPGKGCSFVWVPISIKQQ